MKLHLQQQTMTTNDDWLIDHPSNINPPTSTSAICVDALCFEHHDNQYILIHKTQRISLKQGDRIQIKNGSLFIVSLEDTKEETKNQLSVSNDFFSAPSTTKQHNNFWTDLSILTNNLTSQLSAKQPDNPLDFLSHSPTKQHVNTHHNSSSNLFCLLSSRADTTTPTVFHGGYDTTPNSFYKKNQNNETFNRLPPTDTKVTLPPSSSRFKQKPKRKIGHLLLTKLGLKKPY